MYYCHIKRKCITDFTSCWVCIVSCWGTVYCTKTRFWNCTLLLRLRYLIYHIMGKLIMELFYNAHNSSMLIQQIQLSNFHNRTLCDSDPWKYPPESCIFQKQQHELKGLYKHNISEISRKIGTTYERFISSQKCYKKVAFSSICNVM